MSTAGGLSRILAMAFVVGSASGALAADDGAWSVSKSSGEVWMSSTGTQAVSLGKEDVLKPGDSIRTGRNGRVLLVRGEETILVSPNSVIGLPAEKKEGLSTTIVQRAGSILLEVEKRNVKHFEVETPYLAAVVKGTQFRVSVNAGSTSVDVIRGQVQVADFRSGQIAQVLPGQHATAFAQGNSGSVPGRIGHLQSDRARPAARTVDRPGPGSEVGAYRAAPRRQRTAGPRAGTTLTLRPAPARRQRIASGAARCSWSSDEAWHDPDLFLARRGPVEYPSGHQWSRPRSDTGTWRDEERCQRGYGLDLAQFRDDGHRKQFEQFERREQQHQCRDQA